MILEKITDISRIENDIHYIRRYNGTLHFSLFHSNENMSEINFSIEHDAMGNASIVIDFLKPIDYPLIPAQKKVLTLIKEYDQQGLLR